MSISVAIRHMLNAGFSIEQALQAAEIFEAQSSNIDAQAERRRAKDRERKRLRNSAENAESAEFRGVSLAKEIPPTPPKENSTLPDPQQTDKSVCSAPEGQHTEFFAEFWKVYPKRKGANPRKPALEAFNAQVRSGFDPAQIVIAAGRYAAEVAANGKAGTEFVAQASKWLEQDRFEDYSEPPSEPATDPPSSVLRVEPGSKQWRAWLEHKQRLGERTAFMESEAKSGRGYAVPSEWPPTSPNQSAA